MAGSTEFFVLPLSPQLFFSPSDPLLFEFRVLLRFPDLFPVGLVLRIEALLGQKGQSLNHLDSALLDGYAHSKK
jgi:hypothetical protein